MKLNNKIDYFWKKMATLGVLGSLLFNFVVPPFVSAYSIGKDCSNSVEKKHTKSEDFKLRKALLSMTPAKGEEKVIQRLEQAVEPSRLPVILEEYRAKRMEAEQRERALDQGRSGSFVQTVAGGVRTTFVRTIGKSSLKVSKIDRSVLLRAAKLIQLLPARFKHLSALHAGTLVELVKMIYENHRDDPLLNELFSKSLGKSWSFNELFFTMILKNRTAVPADQSDEEKDGLIRWHIEFEGKRNPKILTEVLRLYLRDYKRVFEVSMAELSGDQKKVRVIEEIQEEMDEAIREAWGYKGEKETYFGPFEFLGLEKVGVRVVEDKYLIKDVNRFILAYYTDDGEWEETNHGKILSFMSNGELVVGISLVERLAQMSPQERSARIHDLVMRELMARTLNQYKHNPGSRYYDVKDYYRAAGYNLGFNGIHHIIDSFPKSRDAIRKILTNFQAFVSDETNKYVAGLDFINVGDRDWTFLPLYRIEKVIKSLTNQENLLLLARDIASKTIAPVVIFGVTFALGLSGFAFALDETILPKEVMNWDSFLFVGGLIGTTLLSFAGRNVKEVNGFVPNRDVLLRAAQLIQLPTRFKHLSALHAGTLVELVKMIYENHMDDPLLNELFSKSLGKPWSFNELFLGVVYKFNPSWEGGEIANIDNYVELLLDLFCEGNHAIELTEFLRLYLRDYKEVFEVSMAELSEDQKKVEVIEEIQEELDEAIREAWGYKGEKETYFGPFEFLGLEKVGIRVIQDKYLIKDVNRFILAFYTDDGEWHKTTLRDSYGFRKEGEIAIGISLVERLTKLSREERSARIHDLVMRELMARTLNQYEQNPGRRHHDVSDYLEQAGYEHGFDGIHHIIDSFPKSRDTIRKILSDFQTFISNKTNKYVAGLDPRVRNRDIYKLPLPKIQKVIKSLTNQENLLLLARDIASKTIAPVFIFGVTFALGLSGFAFALDETILPKEVMNWDSFLFVGGLIGATLISFAGGNVKEVNSLVPERKEEIKSSLNNIAVILGESEIINSLFSLYQRIIGLIEDRGVRLLTNIAHLKEDEDALKELRAFALEAGKEENRDRPYQFVIATDETHISNEEVKEFLIDNKISRDVVENHLLILHEPLENGLFNLERLVERNKDKLLKDGYALRVINNKYWLIVKEIMKNAVLINGLEIFQIQLIGQDIVEKAA